MGHPSINLFLEVTNVVIQTGSKTELDLAQAWPFEGYHKNYFKPEKKAKLFSRGKNIPGQNIRILI